MVLAALCGPQRAGAGWYRRDAGGASTLTSFGLTGGGIDCKPPRSRLRLSAGARFHNLFVARAAWKYSNVYGALRVSLNGERS